MPARVENDTDVTVRTLQGAGCGLDYRAFRQVQGRRRTEDGNRPLQLHRGDFRTGLDQVRVYRRAGAESQVARVQGGSGRVRAARTGVAAARRRPGRYEFGSSGYVV